MTEADPRRWEALPVILVAAFMGLFDVFVVNVAAPDIQRSIHTSSSITLHSRVLLRPP